MDLEGMARQIARDYGLNPDIFVRMIEQESGFDPEARSRVGAIGLAQVMPDTARDPGYGVEPITDLSALLDDDINMRFGAEYLRAMLDKFGGDYGLALAAYNAGPGAVEDAGNRIPNIKETQNYVGNILGRSFEGPEPMPERDERGSGIFSMPLKDRERFLQIEGILKGLQEFERSRRPAPPPEVPELPSEARSRRRVDPTARFAGLGSLREVL
jgi:hypothetical protein